MARRIALVNCDLFAIVDDADYEYLSQFRWYKLRSGQNLYALRAVYLGHGKRQSILMHRELLQAPSDLQVDHIDGNGLNNQRSNLRICTSQENHRNLRPHRGHSSKYKGVSWDKRARCWHAEIFDGQQRFQLGSYHSEIAAARAYNKAAIRLFGDFARLNDLS